MKFFEDKYKDRFKDAQLAEGIDADELWGQIAEALPEEEPLSKTGFISRATLLLCSLFVLLIGGVLLLVNNNNGDEAIAQQAKTPITPTAETNYTLNNDVDCETAEMTQSHRSNNTAAEEKILRAQTTLEANTQIGSVEHKANKQRLKQETAQQEVLMTPQPKKLKQEYTLANANTTVNTFNSSIHTSKTTTQTHFINNNETSVKHKVEHQEELSTSKEAFIDAIVDQTKPASRQAAESIATLDFFVQNEVEQPDKPLVVLEEETSTKHKIRKRTSLPLSAGLTYGTNMWMDFFEQNTTMSQVYKDGYSPVLGNKVALELQWRLNEHWHVETGLAHVVAKSKFDYQHVFDTTMYRNNDPNLDIINAQGTRTVKHYNQLKFVSLPVLLGYTSSKDKLEWGLAAGLGLNFVHEQTGKSINSNEVIQTYAAANNSEVLPYKELFISYQLKPFLNYKLTDKFKLQFKPDVSYQTFGKSDFFGLKHSALVMGLNVGINLDLD